MLASRALNYCSGEDWIGELIYNWDVGELIIWQFPYQHFPVLFCKMSCSEAGE